MDSSADHSANAVSGHRAIRRKLMSWFDRRERDLPWLHNRIPYRIWVSEIMLQQTQLATVANYYRRFIKRFPTVRKLAAADLDDVLKQWEGLGYYRRARQMHKAAGLIVEKFHGRFPTNFEDVLSLPGIGRYTAGAILSIALDQRFPILEGNTIRLFARLLAMEEDAWSSSAQSRLWEFSEQLLPHKRPGDFNQALMDFGREICRPRDPDCNKCPLNNYCIAVEKGLVDSIPVRGRKTRFVERRAAIVLVQRNGKVLMRRCAEGDFWQGLWDFPRFEVEDAAQVEQALLQSTGLQTELVSLGHTISHAVTRYRFKLACFQSTRAAGTLKRGCGFSWKTADVIEELALNASGRKFANRFVVGD